MRICPACQRENEDDTDFCAHCGEYLRWDPTRLQPVVRGPDAPPGPSGAPPPAGGPPAPPPPGRGPADAVSIQLRSLTEDVDPREGIRVSVEPGSTGSLVASIRNQSGIVDNYDLRVEGVPDTWWTITPSTAYLVPYGAPSGRYEQDAQVQIHPPRSSSAEAREWPIRVVAGSRATGTDAGSASARLTVSAYQEVETELRPERGSGRARAKFVFAVRNLANAPIELEFSAVDSEEKCKFAFKQKRGIAQPGKRTGSQLMAKPKKTLWVGRPVDHPFRIEAREPGSEDTVITRPAVYRQRAWVAWWVPIAIIAAIGIGVAGYELLKKTPTISTPDLSPYRASTVQKVLEHLGLLLSTAPAKTKQVAANEVGKVVGQDPLKGFPLHHGDPVSITVGVAKQSLPIPPGLCNVPLTAARAALKKADLQVGPVQPSPTSGAKTLANGCSRPAQGVSVQKGSPVSLFLQGGKGNSVPSTTGQSATDAQSALQKAGLKPSIIPVLATGTTTPGTVVSQQPSSGATLPKGSTIYLYEAEIPSLAYDDGTSIHVVSYRDGTAPTPVDVSTPTGSTEPSWNADGTSIVFSVRGSSGGGAIEAVTPSAGAQAISDLSSSTQDYHRPAFAPLVGSSVIAFTEWNTPDNGHSRLCFLDLSQQPLSPSCTADEAFLLDRPAWSPDGKTVAVVADTGTASSPTPAGVIEFTTTNAFSANQADWHSQTPVLTTADPSFLAFSPVVQNQMQLAYASSNAVYLTSSVSTTGTQIYSYTTSPAFSWRADDELAVGGLGCGGSPPPPPPQMQLITTSGGTASTPFSFSGCNPSLEPLPLPPPS